MSQPKPNTRFRSQEWFDNPANPDMTALYLERYLNFGLTREELQSGKPVIGIAQTGSDLSPCNRPHIELAKRVREGIREAGGIAIEFPVHPIQENWQTTNRFFGSKSCVLEPRGSALWVSNRWGCANHWLRQNHSGSVDGSSHGQHSSHHSLWWTDAQRLVRGERTGSGTIVWRAREMMARGEIDYPGFVDLVASSAPSPRLLQYNGDSNNDELLAEALGMSLPGSAAIPAPYRERAQAAYLTGKRIVDMVKEDLKPSDILTRKAFENAIVINSAIGGSTNAPIHLNAVARHIGVKLEVDDWEKHGHDIPLLVNLQPAGAYLGEDYHHAGGVPAVVAELIRHGKIHEDAITANGKTMGENCRDAEVVDTDVIRSFETALKPAAGFKVLRGNLFDAAIMKTSVISQEFRDQYLSNPDDPDAFEGRAIVFDGPEDYHERIDDPSLNIDANCLLFMRGAGPIGYPGAAEVVNMRAPDYLLKQGVKELPCIGDGRQSGTSGSPSILNASPEAAALGGLALVQMNDRVRIDLKKGKADILIDDAELASRRAKLEKDGFPIPESQTPWQELQRRDVDQLAQGMVLKSALKYQRIAQSKGVPRDNH